jgi:hypothetical protein
MVPRKADHTVRARCSLGSDFSAIGRLYQHADPQMLRWCTRTIETLR